MEKLKELAKNAMTGLLLTLGVMVLTHFVNDLYDLRILIAVLAGKFGYDAVYNLVNKIKALQ